MFFSSKISEEKFNKHKSRSGTTNSLQYCDKRFPQYPEIIAQAGIIDKLHVEFDFGGHDGFDIILFGLG